MTDEELAKLIAEDNLGLLAVKPQRTPQTTEEERLLEGFADIARFVQETGSAPLRVAESIDERRLYTRMESMRSNPRQRELLRPFDEHGILTAPRGEDNADETAPGSIDDILNDPFFDSLDSSADAIFRLEHVPAKSEGATPEYVAQQKPCKDFHLFEEQLAKCQIDLKGGERKLLPFAKEQQIEAGKFFVLRGVLLLVAEVGERAEKNGRWNARLRCIFENGTESDLLLRSLSSALYKDGRRVTERSEDLLKHMLIAADDKASGFIYVLRSLSTDPGVLAVPNLYKIGLARSSIHERIRSALNEPTYLMAPVALVSTFQCYNVNLTKLENLLHRFFAEATVMLQVTDAQGSYHTPKEWFSVPLNTIEAAVRLLISGEIVHYVYEADTGQIALSVASVP